ncbi:hypothetical protein QTJ16_001352 [Diplocarpon rosae]|uniref:Mannosyl transferase n=1 Tax=Diplocarpon rosae TaxID=946125 RepID=A0AAD9T7T9_9HELO|nr:hypothetical protein QTJ16_001352 [Diplocarpon rosae]PBP29022.1 hypothetical protein BUE80_DR000220 [Diplocarpon rosae]
MDRRVKGCREWARKTMEQMGSSTRVQKAAGNPKLVLYGALLLAITAWLLPRAVQYLSKPNYRNRPTTPGLEQPVGRGVKAPPRKPGEWPPMEFERPTASPAPDWDVHTTKPKAYRPFRHGPYHITMGLRNMDWDEWIELDNQYLRYHADKAKRIRERGSKCSYTDPAAFEGAVELLEELTGYLPERYPSLYRKTPVGMDNLVTGESFNIVERPLLEDPMQMAARMTQDDLALMFEKADGQYYLLAGSILLAGFWKLEDKLGMPLSEIHSSGHVPGYKEKLERGMMNFFRRVQPQGPVQRVRGPLFPLRVATPITALPPPGSCSLRHARLHTLTRAQNNYFIQVDHSLPWSSSIGEEDGAEGSVGWFTAEKNKAIEHHFFRSERQSLRRLPRSGGVVFTIRTYFHPITEICEEPDVPGRLASAVRSWGDDVGRYKGRERYQEVLLEYLDQKHRAQLAAGLEVAPEDEVRSFSMVAAES